MKKYIEKDPEETYKKRPLSHKGEIPFWWWICVVIIIIILIVIIWLIIKDKSKKPKYGFKFY